MIRPNLDGGSTKEKTAKSYFRWRQHIGHPCDMADARLAVEVAISTNTGHVEWDNDHTKPADEVEGPPMHKRKEIHAEIAERCVAAATAFKQMGYNKIDARVWMKTMWPVPTPKRFRGFEEWMKRTIWEMSLDLEEPLGIEILISEGDDEEATVLSEDVAGDGHRKFKAVCLAMRKVQTPGLATAKNVEVTMMSLAYAWKELGLFEAYPKHSDGAKWNIECERLIQGCRLGLTNMLDTDHKAADIWLKLEKLQDWWMYSLRLEAEDGEDGPPDRDCYTVVKGPAHEEYLSGKAGGPGGMGYMRLVYPLVRFLKDWLDNAFARVEVSAKLAASLALTDVPEDLFVKAPWDAWVLHIPVGMLDPYVRVLMIGSMPTTLIQADGIHVLSDRLSEQDRLLLLSFARGTCLALSDPERFKRTGGKAGSKGKRKRGQKLPLDQALYLLAAPVKVDLREEIKSIRAGKGGGVKKVQWLVRGHWRNQVCGKGRQQRKTIWIEPHWKGPEAARILLRTHAVEADA